MDHQVFIWIRNSQAIVVSETLVINPTTSTTRNSNYLPWWSLAKTASRTIPFKLVMVPLVLVVNRTELTRFHQLVRFIRACPWVQTWQCSLSIVQRVWIILFPSVKALMRLSNLRYSNQASSHHPMATASSTTVRACNTQINTARFNLDITRLSRVSKLVPVT